MKNKFCLQFVNCNNLLRTYHTECRHAMTSSNTATCIDAHLCACSHKSVMRLHMRLKKHMPVTHLKAQVHDSVGNQKTFPPHFEQKWQRTPRASNKMPTCLRPLSTRYLNGCVISPGYTCVLTSYQY